MVVDDYDIAIVTLPVDDLDIVSFCMSGTSVSAVHVISKNGGAVHPYQHLGRGIAPCGR